MKITAVDDAKDLFLVENIFPIDWLKNIPMDLEWQQLKHWPRKLLPTFGLHNDHPFAKMNLKLQSMEPYWMEFFGETVMVQEPRVWWDDPGFYMKAHIDGDVDDVLSLGNLKAKWEAFGWCVLESNGNDIVEVIETLNKAKELTGKQQPIVIIMKTEMGFGVDYMMGSHKWHGVAPNDEQLEIALNQLPETLGDY